ncbi:hypothetical protein sce3248 [Sorangium cellulosum So ce56]|uniref:AAA+ ATPase domain-containing protein n=1 Tax=Sorangium cellulosum (strain So ce56) TaxID=448385 RepID=A9GJH2_SORC5|nr:ATP-binding protein [Sorangium cellulosum]CAN93407.1 hypothetical protein sce3248 [Sorangium cellulosum So ce56]
MLTDEQLTTVWKGFTPPAGWAKWQKDYLDFLRWARDIPESELRTEAAQRKLWNARAITPAGYGDAINIDALLADPEFVDTIVGLRGRAFSPDVAVRAAEIQGEYERILGMAVAREVKPRPHAKLQRLVGALVPAELSCVLSYDAAHLLRYVDEHRGATDAAVVDALQKIYPAWTTAGVPNDLRNWSLYLGLLKRDQDGGLQLTEYGAARAARLPKELPKPPAGEIIDTNPPGGTTAVVAKEIPYPAFDAILTHFKSDPEIADFVFEDRQLASLHAAWRSNPRKRFVLLSGLSGTGKTAVTLCYSRAVCELMGLSVSEHREIVPVSPDWRDPSGLLGYFNALHANPTFQAEPALRLVLRAAADPGRPYFLVLDEMNLARVERYFAPFLSAMETGKELVLHANGAEVNDVPPRVPWPANLHIAGTVNMDETTHPFSDKVLDRAFTLEFWDVDLKRFFERAATKSPGKRLPDVEAVLLELHGAMRTVRRHFGYRTAGEVLAFMHAVPELGGAAQETFLDQAVFSKVLPRLRGEDTPAFKGALETLQGICKRRGLTMCEAKLATMMELLKRTGVTRFWA